MIFLQDFLKFDTKKFENNFYGDDTPHHQEIYQIIKSRLYSIIDDSHDMSVSFHDYRKYESLLVFINFAPPCSLKNYSDDIKGLISELEFQDWNLESKWMIVFEKKNSTHRHVYTIWI